ncbi:MAG: hypothetical protein D9C04_05635 [Nitrosopumilus sp. B06]|nr:MAG: hypothetical protein D9C04_05635 [Nitrosopumilus sp. B06]
MAKGRKGGGKDKAGGASKSGNKSGRNPHDIAATSKYLSADKRMYKLKSITITMAYLKMPPLQTRYLFYRVQSNGLESQLRHSQTMGHSLLQSEKAAPGTGRLPCLSKSSLT